MNFLRTVFGGKQSDEERAEKLFWQAMKEQEKGNLKNTIRILEEAIALDPKNIKYKNNLATYYGKVGDWNAAENLWQEIIKIAPNSEYAVNYASILANNGYLAYKGGKVQIMLQLYKKALSVDPNQPLALKELGIHHQGNKEWKEAIDHYQQAIKTATKPLGGSASLNDYRAELRDRLATCYLENGDYHLAIETWEKALTEKNWDASDRKAIMEDITKAKNALQTLS